MSEEKDQDALAAEWAAQLEDDNDEQTSAETTENQASSDENVSSDEELASRWAEALADDQETESKSREKASLRTQATDAHFADMTDIAKRPTADGAKRELDFILDIPLDVSAELGRTRLLINELLQLGQGSVVELNKLAGEPLEVYVNGKLVARGEAVVINEKFGVRLTDIISPMERVKQLG